MTEPPRPPGDDPTGGGNSYPPPGSPPPQSPPPQSPPPPGYVGGQPGYPPPADPPYGSSPPFGAPPPGSAPYGSPPPGGAPQYGYGSGPAGFGNDEDRMWVMVSHFGGAAAAFVTGGWAGWLAPLVALLVRGGQSPAVRSHAAKALNFQLLCAVVALGITIISTCLTIIIIGALGFWLLPIPWLAGTLVGIIAGVKALNGEPFDYPLGPNWVK